MVKESGSKTGPGPGKAHRPTTKTTDRAPDEERSFLLQVAALAARAFQLAAKAGGTSIEVGKALIVSSSGDTKLMRESGAYLKDLRELAGLTQAELAALLITRSEQVMSLFLRDGWAVHIPTVAREVYDVTGAGDTVLSVMGLGMA